jgi:FAD-dependent urate hydroxylase
MGKALIIGGGVAGPVAAMALQRAGIEGVVYEAHVPTGEEVGSYLTVASNGLDALGAIGADGPVLDAGFPTPTPTPTNILLSSNGRRLEAVSNGGRLTDGTAAHTIKRARLYQTLHQQASDRGVQVEFGKRLVNAQPTPDGGVIATFVDGTQAGGALLVGADGIHSTTRTLIDPAAPGGRYVGLVNFGGYTPEPAAGAEPGVWHMNFGRRAFFGYVVDPADGTVWFANVPRPPVSRAERDATGAQQGRRQLLELYASDRGPATDLIAAGPAGVRRRQYLRPAPGADLAAGLDGDHRRRGARSCAHLRAGRLPGRRGRRGPGQVPARPARHRSGARRLRAAAPPAGGTHRRPGGPHQQHKTPGLVGRLLRDLMLPVVFRFLVTDRLLAWRYDHHIDWDAPITLTTKPA